MTSTLCLDCPADVPTQDGALRCEACVRRTHNRCPGCREWYPDEIDCVACESCDVCDAAIPSGTGYTLAGGEALCTDCRVRSYWICDECDECTRDSEDLCANGCSTGDECEYCDTSHSGLVHGYEYKPEPVFHGAGPLYLGLELEVCSPAFTYTEDEAAGTALDHLGDLGYLKHDASVEDGFEIVTHPMSYTWAQQHFPWGMLTELRELGCDTSADTGLHVHLSRDGFDGPAHCYRWMKFVYRNQAPISLLARRSSSQWAAFTDGDRRAVKHYAKGAASNRYTAINTGNTDTYELRIFASSLDTNHVQAALALAEATAEYTRALTVPVITRGGWTWAAFTGWVSGQPQYAVLAAEMQTGVGA